MKIKIQFFIIAAVYLLFSCENVTEEIYINKDGSGKYEIYTTQSTSAMQQDMMDLTKDSTGIPNPLVGGMMMNLMWNEMGEEIDTLMEIPDSNKAHPLKLEYGDRIKLLLRGGRAKGHLKSGLQVTFDDINEFSDLWGTLFNSESFKKDMPPGTDFNIIPTNYEVNKRSFLRKGEFLSNFREQLIGLAKIDNASPEEVEELIAMMTKTIGDSKMKTIVHLPRRIKSVEGTNFITPDDKTVIFELSLSEVLRGNLTADFQINMKRK